VTPHDDKEPKISMVLLFCYQLNIIRMITFTVSHWKFIMFY